MVPEMVFSILRTLSKSYLHLIFSSHMMRKEACTCNDPFSMECPLHTKPNSDMARQNNLQLQSRNMATDETKEGHSVENQLEDPICECQVKYIYVNTFFL